MRRWLAAVEEVEADVWKVIAGETVNGGRTVSRDYNGEMLENVRRRAGDLIEEYIRRNPGTEIGK